MIGGAHISALTALRQIVRQFLVLNNLVLRLLMQCFSPKNFSGYSLARVCTSTLVSFAKAAFVLE